MWQRRRCGPRWGHRTQPCHKPSHGFPETLDLDGLGQKIARRDVKGMDRSMFIGADDDPERNMGARCPGKVDPIAVSQARVEEHHLRLDAVDGLPRAFHAVRLTQPLELRAGGNLILHQTTRMASTLQHEA